MSIKPIVEVGDRVRDPLDGSWRTVTRVDTNDTVFMADGGVMGINECTDIRLPSEATRSDFVGEH